MTVRLCHGVVHHYYTYFGAQDDLIPAGYCSLLCWLLSRKPREKREPMGPSPHDVLGKIRLHLVLKHSTRRIKWFDCEECDRLQEQYAEALACMARRM